MEKRREIAFTRVLAVVVFLQFSCLNGGLAWVSLPATAPVERVPFFTLVLSQFAPSYRTFFAPALPSETPFLAHIRASLASAWNENSLPDLRSASSVAESVFPALLPDTTEKGGIVHRTFASFLASFKRLNKRQTQEEPSRGKNTPQLDGMKEGPSYHAPPKAGLTAPRRSPLLKPRSGPPGAFSDDSSSPSGLGLSPGAFSVLRQAVPPPGIEHLSSIRKHLVRRLLTTGSGFGIRDGDPWAFHVVPDKRAPNFLSRIGRFSFALLSSSRSVQIPHPASPVSRP
jgi:hypothetical protein